MDVASLDGFFSWKCRWPVMKLPLNDVIMDVTAKRHWKGGEFLRANYVTINETGWTVAAERRDCERGWKILQPRREFFHRRAFFFLFFLPLLSPFFLFSSLLFFSRCRARTKRKSGGNGGWKGRNSSRLIALQLARNVVGDYAYNGKNAPRAKYFIASRESFTRAIVFSENKLFFLSFFLFHGDWPKGWRILTVVKKYRASLLLRSFDRKLLRGLDQVFSSLIDCPFSRELDSYDGSYEPKIVWKKWSKDH